MGERETRAHVCTCCGLTVRQTHNVAFVDYADGRGGIERVWRTERHDAPCGLPCMGGGVSPRSMRRDGDGVRWIHGMESEPCPRCTPTPPTEREE